MGAVNASQYKDYVLFMLFIKYISDKYGNSDAFAPPVVIPKGASFKDMIALKGKPDIPTAGLARMNMILHDFPTANVQQGDTLAAPKFKDGEQLRAYDYVVANPPFSDYRS